MQVGTFPNPICLVPGYRDAQQQPENKANAERNPVMLEDATTFFGNPHSVLDFSFFATLFSALFLVQSALDMDIVKQKLKSANKKKGLWEMNVTHEFATNKINNIIIKRKNILYKAETILVPKVNKTCKAWFGSSKRGQVKKGRAYENYHEACREFLAAHRDFKGMNTNLKSWTRIRDKIQNNTVTAEDTKLLSTLKTNKLEKWKTKIKNISLNKIDIGLRLGLSIYITVLTIAFIALLIIFPVAMPLGAAIGLGIGGTIALGGFIGQCFLHKCKPKQEPYEPVEIPLLPLAGI